MTSRAGHGWSVLLIEDDRQIAQAIDYRLSKEGFRVAFAPDADAAMRLLAQHRFDLLILDIGLPGVDGFTMLQSHPGMTEKIPVLILTARDATEDKVRGLRLGAEDYLTKPFDFSELMARIDVILRRARKSGQHGLRIGNLEIFSDQKKIIVDGQDAELSPREFEVLSVFVERPNRVISKREILQRLADQDLRAADLNDSAVEVIVHRLRKKLERASAGIQTVRGFGYVFR